MIPATAAAKPGCKRHVCFERVAAQKCSQSHPQWCVERAIVTYRLRGWQAAWMRRIPSCESTWNPYARGGPNVGLYQFNVGTWAGTPYARRSPFRAKWAALAAGWMLRQGRSREWSCT